MARKNLQQGRSEQPAGKNAMTTGASRGACLGPAETALRVVLAFAVVIVVGLMIVYWFIPALDRVRESLAAGVLVLFVQTCGLTVGVYALGIVLKLIASPPTHTDSVTK
jgi:hypothetical protein